MKKFKVIDIKGVKLGDGIVKICYPVTSATAEAILDEMNYVKDQPCDIVEWRVDFFEDAHDEEAVFALLPKIREIIGDSRVLMFVVRTADEGGNKTFERAYYFQLINRAIDSGLIDIIDIEYYSGRQNYKKEIEHAKEKGVVSIGSQHIYGGTPNAVEMVDIIDMIHGRADIAKLAVLSQNRKDTERVLEAGRMLLDYENTTSPFILIAMGEAGTETRRTDKFFGSCLSYCQGRDSMSPGQLPLDDLVEMRKKVLEQ